MNVQDLIVEVRDGNLNRVGQLGEIDIAGLTVVARANAVGSWEIELPDTVVDASGVEGPHGLSAALREPGAGVIVTGPDGVILSGPMTEALFAATADDPRGVWTITGVSDMVLLQDALAFPDPKSADPAAQEFANDVRKGPAETLLRQYVALNVCNGALADRPEAWAPAGRLVGLRQKLRLQEQNLGRGPALSFSPRFDNLLELAQRIAQAGELAFDVVQIDDLLEVRIWEPSDRSDFVRMDVWNEQLDSVEFGFGAPTATRPLMAGQGEGTERAIIERTNASSALAETRWGRRIERFVDKRGTEDVIELAQAGDAILAEEGVTVETMQVTPADDLPSVFLRDWTLGDVVAVTVGTETTSARVTEAALQIKDGVQIVVTVGDPTGFAAEDVSHSRASATEGRVSALERNAEAKDQLPPTPGIPAGTLLYGAWATVPTGYLLANGAAVSRVTYAELYAAIGTQYGTGNGTTTFNLPDLTERTLVGLKSGSPEFGTLGQKTGAKTHTLSVAEMPSHSHAGRTNSTVGTGSGWSGVDPLRASTAAYTQDSQYISPTGGNGAHNNIQPSFTAVAVIKT